MKNTKIWFVYQGTKEAATGGETVFLKFLQNPQENTCARVSFLIRLFNKTFFFPVDLEKYSTCVHFSNSCPTNREK